VGNYVSEFLKKRIYLESAAEDQDCGESMDVMAEFDELVIEPLRSCSVAISGPVLLILDGVDQAGDRMADFVVSILARSAEFPSFLRILVAGRPEADLCRAIERSPLVHSYSLDWDAD
jgi:hypothetical protein